MLTEVGKKHPSVKSKEQHCSHLRPDMAPSSSRVEGPPLLPGARDEFYPAAAPHGLDARAS